MCGQFVRRVSPDFQWKSAQGQGAHFHLRPAKCGTTAKQPRAVIIVQTSGGQRIPILASKPNCEGSNGLGGSGVQTEPISLFRKNLA